MQSKARENNTEVESGDNDSQKYLAKTIYGEARGQSKKAKIAVGWVIKNRVKSDQHPDNYKDVVKEPAQFSCWDDNNYKAMQNPKGKAWEVSKKVAKGIKKNTIKRPSKLDGVVNFYSPKSMEGRPKWSSPEREFTIEGVKPKNFKFLKP